MNIPIFLLPIFFLILFIISFKKDRSKYRNCYYLFFIIFFSIYLLLSTGKINISIIIGITLLLILMLPIFLVTNGIITMKREGRSLSHMLSLVLGLLIGFGEVATYIAVLVPVNIKAGGNRGINDISLFFSMSIIYLSLTFVVFVLYCLFLQIIPKKRDFNYIIIHGSGLIAGDKVPKLLSDRIDKALEIYNKSSIPSKLILSGGQGNDEKISEAEAMRRYCIEKGISKNDLIIEDKSTTTFENLKNSKEIINNKPGNKKTVLVTSNYHVYRALRYCKKINLDCTGVGSHVAFYYWPSALIREYIAVHAEKKHLIMFIIGWLIFMTPWVLIFFNLL